MDQKDSIIKQGYDFLTEGGFNAFRVEEWKETVEADSFNISEYEKLLLYFSVNAFQTTTGFSSAEPPRFIASLEKELYNTLSDAKNQGKANVLMAAAIGGLAAAIATPLGLSVAIVSGFLNLVIISAMKIGVGAWCSHYEEKTKIVNDEGKSDDQ